MINVHGIHHAVAPQAAEPVARIAARAPAEPLGANDVIEISAAARLAAKVHVLPEVRADLIARVKVEIENGTYETPERLEGTVNKLMEELFPDL